MWGHTLSGPMPGVIRAQRFKAASFLPSGAESPARESRLTLKARSDPSPWHLVTVYVAVTLPEAVNHGQLENAGIANKVLGQPCRRERSKNWEKKRDRRTGEAGEGKDGGWLHG